MTSRGALRNALERVLLVGRHATATNAAGVIRAERVQRRLYRAQLRRHRAQLASRIVALRPSLLPTGAPISEPSYAHALEAAGADRPVICRSTDACSAAIAAMAGRTTCPGDGQWPRGVLLRSHKRFRALLGEAMAAGAPDGSTMPSDADLEALLVGLPHLAAQQESVASAPRTAWPTPAWPWRRGSTARRSLNRWRKHMIADIARLGDAHPHATRPKPPPPSAMELHALRSAEDFAVTRLVKGVRDDGDGLAGGIENSIGPGAALTDDFDDAGRTDRQESDDDSKPATVNVRLKKDDLLAIDRALEKLPARLSCFFDLLQMLLRSFSDMRAVSQSRLEVAVRKWRQQLCDETLNPWVTVQRNWRALTEPALRFMNCDVPEAFEDEPFVPLVRYRERNQLWRAVGSSLLSETELRTLCDRWLRTRYVPARRRRRAASVDGSRGGRGAGPRRGLST